MTVTAKIIADSVHGSHRLTTMQLRYPRFIHAEVMTHRVFSRNASSSRAIPVERLIQDVENDPAMPVHWGANKPGMQAGDELESGSVEWLLASSDAIHRARRMARMGYHKQIVNRILEPFAHINVIVSATEWDNFFALRAHPDAQPEIQALALAMRDAMADSDPAPLQHGGWHLPYITAGDRVDNDTATLCRMSAARCARVSYMTHDGKEPTRDADLALFDRLAGSAPIHASPLEHVATPAMGTPRGNFKGWTQFRQYVEDGNAWLN